MKKTDVLFRETLARVGNEEMRGIERLVDGGHYGIAERHTVSKLFGYIRQLEKKVGIVIPSVTAKTAPVAKNMLKVNERGLTYFLPSASGNGT